MRTLQFALRVTDLDRSLAFTSVGNELVGEVSDPGTGHLVMLRRPDDDFVSLELVHRCGPAPVAGTAGPHHVVVQVDRLDQMLAARGIPATPPASPAGAPGVHTAWITDPAGTRIGSVQRPAGHAAGVTLADWSSPDF